MNRPSDRIVAFAGTEVQVFDDSLRTECDTFVRQHPDATICHDLRWIDILERALGHRPNYLVARRDGRVCGVLPLFLVTSWWGSRGLVSIPWLDYGGILADDPETESLILAAADKLREELRAASVEMRSVTTERDDTRQRDDKVTFRLDLSPGAESIWKEFNAKLRNQVRKSEKSGLVTTFGGIEYLDDFYTVFCRNMRDLGTPVWGRTLFASILEKFGEESEIVIVRNDGRTVAAGLLLKWRGQWYVPSASSYREVRSMCPNHALYWTIIERAAHEGAVYFDFGRSTWDGPTFRFKKQWVPEPTPLAWQYLIPEGEELPVTSPDNPKYRLLIAAWQRLPLAVANWLGPKVIRNFP